MGVESARFTRANLTRSEMDEMAVVDRLADELAEYPLTAASITRASGLELVPRQLLN